MHGGVYRGDRACEGANDGGHRLKGVEIYSHRDVPHAAEHKHCQVALRGARWLATSTLAQDELGGRANALELRPGRACRVTLF